MPSKSRQPFSNYLQVCQSLPDRFESVHSEYHNEFRGQEHPVHLDLHLAASQASLYEEIVAVGSAKGKASTSEAPLVPLLAAHYFTYDRTRITKIISKPGVTHETVHDHLNRHRKNKKVYFAPHDSPSFNHLLMLAYRQIFQEKNTLNAWLLRTADRLTENRDAKFSLFLGDGIHHSDSRSTTVPSSLAEKLVPDNALRAITKIVAPLCHDQTKADGASERVRLAAKLYSLVTEKEKEIRKLLPTYEALQQQLKHRPADLDALDSAQNSIFFQLKIPTWPRSSDFLDRVTKNVHTMLQSAIFYMRLYKTEAFYTLTTLEKGVPYGLTALAKLPLDAAELEALHEAINCLSHRQHEVVREAFARYRVRSTEKGAHSPDEPVVDAGESTESLLADESNIAALDSIAESEARNPPQQAGFVDLPEQSQGETLQLRFRNTPRGKKLWNEIRDSKSIPAWALATLTRILEQAAESEVEHHFPQTAFVLGQSSYLESVGFVTVPEIEISSSPVSYLDLVRDPETNLLGYHAKIYELQRWETGRGILPYDIVVDTNEKEKVKEEEKNRNGKQEPGDVKTYLMDKWGFPSPGDGFHLIDLDPTFVHPAIGIGFVKRAIVGKIGWFQEGSPPAGDLGYRAYFGLTTDINRCVVGVTNGKGNAALITDGRVSAVYRRRAWEFYDRESAAQTIVKITDEAGGTPISQELAQDLLKAAERLSHTHRKGGMFVVVDFEGTIKEWAQGDERKKYFIKMIDSGDMRDIQASETDSLVSVAQIDGCCVVSQSGNVLGYGYKISVNANEAFDLARENGSKSRIRNEDDMRREIIQPGTRRWSSAILSLGSNWPVLNISSDGPVTLFTNGTKERIYPSDPETEKKEP